MQPIVELIRLEEHTDWGTIGVLKINKKVFCMTLEPADRENATNVSSIPTQQYQCQRYVSNKFGETFQVMNVPDRSYILFHKGNIDDHTQGCILLGETVGKLASGDRAVLNSGRTFAQFLKVMEPHVGFHLTITENY